MPCRRLCLLAGALVISVVGELRPGKAYAEPAESKRENITIDSLRALRQDVADLRLKRIAADVEADELNYEGEFLKSFEASVKEPSRPPARPRFLASDKIWNQGMPGIRVAEGTVKDLESLAKEARDGVSEARKAWDDVVSRDLTSRDKWAREDEILAIQPSNANGGSNLLSDLAGPFLFGILAMLGGLILTAHEARDRLRWRLRAQGSQPIAVALVLLFAAALATPGCSGSRDGLHALQASREREQDELNRLRHDQNAKIKEIEEANRNASERLNRLLETVRRDRATFGLWPKERESEAEAQAGIDSVAKIQDQFRAIRVAALTIRRLDADRAEIFKEHDQKAFARASIEGERQSAAVRAALVRLGVCGAMGIAAFAPLQLVRHARRRRLNEDTRLCPCCESIDTLDVVPDHEHALSDDPAMGRKIKDRLFECSNCQLELRENLVRQNRLSFPTIGIRSSGKTHWMVILYDRIKNSNVPVASTVRSLPSRKDAEFDALVRSLLYERRGPSPSVTGDRLPQPLVFHVHDADPLGANRTTLNLLDFSGEIVKRTIDDDKERLRALRCQGFTLFLDPTQVVTGPWSRSDSTIEDQIQTLARFSAELHAVRGVAPERPIDLPVAVCISKFDLISHQNPIGTQAMPFVAELRKTIDREVDLELIHERSQLCARAMPLMFPGWNLERSLREQFGGRFMFFPISSVGLEEEELGEANLAGRTFTPFGVLEPMLWLLHMHGYCVLR